MCQTLYGEAEREVGGSMLVCHSEWEARSTVLGGEMERKNGHVLKDGSRLTALWAKYWC